MLTVANDGKWDKTMEEFIRWSLEYDMWCKMKFFHEGIRLAETDTGRSNQRGPRNLLDSLPEIFTMEDAVRVRRMAGLSEAGTGHMISSWKYRGYISQYHKSQFRKINFSTRNGKR